MAENLEEYISEVGYNFVIVDESLCDLSTQENQVQAIVCQTQKQQTNLQVIKISYE